MATFHADESRILEFWGRPMIDNKPTTWTLTDWYGSPWCDDVKPVISIESSQQLRRELECFGPKEPRVLHLESSAGLLIRVGIGGPFGHVHLSDREKSKPACFASAPNRCTEEDVPFAYDYQPSPIGPEFLLPIDQVIEIVTEIYGRGAPPDWVQWESR
jgi:hypothetical protein